MMENKDFTDQYIQGFFNFIDWSDEMLLLAIILILADLFFGIKAARKRKEKVRISGSWRRTINKTCSYLLWILIAYSFGEVFGKPFGIVSLPTIMIFVIYSIELESIYSNYFEWKGIKAKVNILKFFSKKTDIIEVEEKNEEDHESTI